MSILQFLIKPIGQKLITPKKQLPAGSPKVTPHASAKKSCDISERQINGIWVYDMSLRSAGTGVGDRVKRRRIYYFAGGAWQMPPSSEHWKLCAEICQRIPGIVVSVVSYPLAPNSAAPMAFPQLVEFYDEVMQGSKSDKYGGHDNETGKDEIVTFMGDSAGGNVVLGLVLHALSRPGSSTKAPDSLVVISPTTDCRAQDANEATMREVEKNDPLLSVSFTNEAAATWCADWDRGDARVSPLLADIEVLNKNNVRVYGITGSYDVLTPPTDKFRDRCEQAGVEGEWLDWAGQMHCFPLAWMYGLRESKEAKEWMVDVLRR